jgi:hypothetical protein
MPMLEEINQTAAAAGMTAADFQEAAEMQPLVQRPRFDFSKLTAETGEGSIEEYMTHPMNWDNSKETARIIRGVTGIAGKLNLAIVDILIGLFGIQKKRADKNEQQHSSVRTNESFSYEGGVGN